MAAVTHSVGKASSPSGAAKAAAGKADTGTAFAAAIAGAADPGTSGPTLPAVQPPRGRKAGDKSPQHVKRDDDPAQDDDPATLGADGSTPIAIPLAMTTSDATPTKSGKPTSDGPQRAGKAAVAAPANDPAAIDLTQAATDVADPKLAPVLAALADSLAAKQAGDQPSVPLSATPVPSAPAPVTTTPTTATAALMASRIAPPGAPFSGSADARVTATSSHKSDDDSNADADSAAAAIDPTAATPTSALTVATSTSVGANRHAPVTDGAANQLANGAADRQLDLAKQGAWLDGIAHDIASTGAGSGPLRFAVAPQHLGSVQVEMTRDAVGATVTFTASSEAGRVALADARPQLITEARAQGIHIASAQVDVGGGQAGSDSRPPSYPNDSRHSSSAGGGFSAQANAQGDSGRQSQTRSQPSAANPVSKPGLPDADAAPEPADGLYA